jgi:hypothetical protein
MPLSQIMMPYHNHFGWANVEIAHLTVSVFPCALCPFIILGYHKEIYIATE